MKIIDNATYTRTVVFDKFSQSGDAGATREAKLILSTAVCNEVWLMPLMINSDRRVVLEAVLRQLRLEQVQPGTLMQYILDVCGENMFYRK